MNGEMRWAVLELVPKSYHFDGYNAVNVTADENRSFFSDGCVTFKKGNKLSINRIEKMGAEPKLELSFEPIFLDEYEERRRDKEYSFRFNMVFGKIVLTLSDYVAKLTKAIQNDADFITFEVPVTFVTCRPSGRVAEVGHLDYIDDLYKRFGRSMTAAVSFNMGEVKRALEVYHGIVPNKDNNMGGFNMKGKKNFFGMNFEFGRSKDQNLASTLMGVAVRNSWNGNWYVYNQATNSRQNIANVKLGNLPMFLLPVRLEDLQVGDLIKRDGNYYYVQAKNGNGSLILANAADGIICECMAEHHILGMTFVTKVVAVDMASLTNPISKENLGGNVLAAMCLMGWSGGEKSEFSLDNINDESFNGLGSFLPLLMASGGGNLGSMFKNPDGSMNLAAIMMLGAGSGENDMDGMMQMLLLQQFLGGNMNVLGKTADAMKGVLTGVSATEGSEEAEVACEKCGATYSAGVNFCPKCGGVARPIAKHCKFCGTKLMQGAMFCHKCGTSVLNERVCRKCGRTLESDEKFCMNCGTKAGEDAPKSVPSMSTVEIGERVREGIKNSDGNPDAKLPPTSYVDEKGKLKVADDAGVSPSGT